MNSIKNLIERIPKPLKNKYIITLTAFSIWIIFIDDYNIIKQRKIKKSINKLEIERKTYLKNIKQDSIREHNLIYNQKEQEKVAREKYLMKKKNEDIYVIKKKKND